MSADDVYLTGNQEDAVCSPAKGSVYPQCCHQGTNQLWHHRKHGYTPSKPICCYSWASWQRDTAVTRAPTNCDIIGNTATHQASLSGASWQRDNGHLSFIQICPLFRFDDPVVPWTGNVSSLPRCPVWHIITTVVDNEKAPFIERRPCTHVFESSIIHRGYTIKTENRVSCLPDGIWR